MRNLLWFLSAAAVVLLAIFVLLPVVGVLLLIIVGVLVLAVAFFLAAPLLARLPWFRDRIHVERYGNARTVRFGGGTYTTYRDAGPARPQGEEQPGRLDHGDVIDVEGREIDEPRNE